MSTISIKKVTEISEDKIMIDLHKDEIEGRYAFTKFGLAHDYFYVEDLACITENGRVLKYSLKCRIKVPIRSFIQVMLPKLISNKYSQLDHIKDHPANSDGTNFKKGDMLPSYSYYHQVVEFYEENELMVAVLIAGERKFSYMTKTFFDKFVKNTLTY